MNEVVAPSATVFGQTVEPAGIVSKDLRIHRIEGIVLQVPLPVLSKAVTGPLRNALTVLTRQARHDHGDAVCLDSNSTRSASMNISASWVASARTSI
jgi:hypothetical protein